MSKKHKVTFQSDLKSLAGIRLAVSRFLQENLCPEDDIHAVELAVHEASSNIIRHAYPDKTGSTIDLHITLGTEDIIIVLEDQGIPLDQRVYGPDHMDHLKNTAPSVSPGQEGGMGLYMISKLMHRVKATRTGSKNILEMGRTLG